MPAAKPTDIVQVKLRIREGLRRRLLREAEKQGRSLNAELEDRLAQSIGQDDLFGGPELRQVGMLMVAAFGHAGDVASGGKKPNEWMGNPEIYAQALHAVIDTLRVGVPPLTPVPDAVDKFMALLARARTPELLRRQLAFETDPTVVQRIQDQIKQIEEDFERLAVGVAEDVADLKRRLASQRSAADDAAVDAERKRSQEIYERFGRGKGEDQKGRQKTQEDQG